MNPQEFTKLLEFIHENNGWQHTLLRIDEPEGARKKRPLVKYVTSHFDTREGLVFSIALRYNGIERVFDLTEKEEVEKMYNWLNNEEQEISKNENSN